MAQKRMFDKSITNSDDFMEMPDGAQILYFHLSMNADDDGFVNEWRGIMKRLGSKIDDFNVLIAKAYVIPFESGVIVIRHWRINNFLRKDRYVETKFRKEKEMLTTNDNNEYVWLTKWQPSIDKNSIDKNSINTIMSKNGTFLDEKETQNSPKMEQNDTKKNQDAINFEIFWLRFPRKEGKKKAKEWFLKRKPSEELFEKIMEGLENQLKTQGSCLNKDKKYIPLATSWLNGERWEDEYDFKPEEDIFDKVAREFNERKEKERLEKEQNK